jgi:hypothetical protein
VNTTSCAALRELPTVTAYQNAGGQVDLSFTVVHRYTITLSAGYAVGREPSGRTENEWMVSLKIL